MRYPVVHSPICKLDAPSARHRRALPVLIFSRDGRPVGTDHPGPTLWPGPQLVKYFFISRGLTGHFYFFIFLVVKFFDQRPFFRTPAGRPETVRNVPIHSTVMPVPTGAFSPKHHAVPPRQFFAIGHMGKFDLKMGKKLLNFSHF